MRRPRTEAPTHADIDRGQYDAAFLLGAHERLLLARSCEVGDGVLHETVASGGVISETLAAALDSGEVDAVLGVGFAADDPVTPTYLVSRTRKELLRCAGSIYSYISPREFFSAVKAVEGERIAVVCQPCMVPMMRRFQQRPGQRIGAVDIRYVISFFCGYNMTHEATTYLLGKAGVRPQDVQWIRYRYGEYPGGFAVKAGSGPKAGEIVRFDKASYEYANLAFLRDGCSRCSYYMGEGADISCGDAWLNEHRKLTSVLVRSEAGQRLLDLAADRLEQYELPEATLLHMHLHNLIYKKHGNTRLLRLLTTFFRDILPPWLAPFTLLSWLSRQRRKHHIGVSLPTLTPLHRGKHE